MASPRCIARLLPLSVLCVVASAALATAQTLAYSTLNWERVPHVIPGEVKVRLNYEVGYNRSSPFGSTLAVGDTLVLRFPMMASDGSTFTHDGLVSITSLLAGENLLLGKGSLELVVRDALYPLEVTTDHGSFGRLPDLREGNDHLQLRMRTVIDPLRADRSPAVIPVPRIYLGQDAAAAFLLPAIVPEDARADVTFSAPAASGLVTAAPIGWDLCNGLPVCIDDHAMTLTPGGLASWTPRLAGKYGVQFTITARDDQGPTSTTILDTVVEVVPYCNPTLPGCTVRPWFTSAPPSVRVKAGETLSIPFSASGVSAPTTLLPLWMPASAELVATSAAGAAVTGELRWTPTPADAGIQFACVQAVNSAGQANFGIHCATIEVWRDFVVTFASPPPFSLAAPVPSQAVAPGEFAVQPADPTTTQTGFYFVGWTLDPNPSSSASLFLFPYWPVPRDLTLYAAWTSQQRTVTFNSNGGTPVPARTVAFTAAIAAPPPPTRGNDAFAGWYADAGLTVPFQFGNDRIYENTTLHAKWTPWVTLSFYSVGALIGSSSGLAPHLPGIITPVPRDGFEFGGWYLDTAFTTPFNLGTPVVVHTSVYARWTSLHVPHVFTGFFAPVDNLPVLNVGKAGRTIPVRWRLAKADGTPVTALTSFVVLTESAIACDASPDSMLEEQLAESIGSGIRYDEAEDQFIYNWKTAKGVTGCRLITVTLDDGSRYSAKFRLQ